MISVDWGGIIRIDSTKVSRISMRSQYGITGGGVPTKEEFINQLPTEKPATITIEARDLEFSEISTLKSLFYNSANYSSPTRSATLKIGTKSFDRCNLEYFTFNYSKIYSRNLFAPIGSANNIGIWGDVTVRFNRWLVY